MSLRPPRFTSPALLRASRPFWCHQCRCPVRILPPPSSTSEVFCSRCFGQFVQELNIPWPPPPPPPPNFFPDFPPPNPHLHLHHLFPPWTPIQRPSFPGHFILPPPPPPPPNYSIPPTVHPGDYFTGPNLGDLIQDLTQNDSSGPPPAPASSIDALPTVQITAAHLRGDHQCPVCKELFQVGEEAREMPCHHVYHSDCIVPWLRMHNSCPVCRYQLPGAEPASMEQSTGDGRDSVGGGGNREQQRPERWSPFTLLSALRSSTPDGRNHRDGTGDWREQSGDPIDSAAAFYSWWRSLFLL